MHLVLPLLPMPATFSTTSVTSTENPVNFAEQPNPSTSSTGADLPQSDQGLRHRGAAAQTNATQADLMNALRRNVETIRQRVEEQQRQAFFQEQQAADNAASTSQPTSTSLPTWGTNAASPSNLHNAQVGSHSLFGPRTTSLFDNHNAVASTSLASHSHAPYSSSVGNSTSSLFGGDNLALNPTSHLSTQSNATSSANSSNARRALFAGLDDSQGDLARIQRVQELRSRIEIAETQLSQGAMPPIDQVIDIRTQLLEVQDERYRNRFYSRNGEVESLITRILNVYQRTDQLRIMQDHLPSRPTPISVPPLVSDTSNQVFMVRSPHGYQGIITSPGAPGLFPTDSHQPQPVHFGGTGPGSAAQAQPNANATAAENIVRQAALNRQQRGNDEQPILARYLRRIWLFIRLYFFCYMISDPGTWMRIFLVSMAVVAAVFGESDIPQQLHRRIVAPVQRHLEGLVHLGEPAAAEQNAFGAQADNAAPRNTLAASLQLQLRRAERSLVLFLASLVPGIGERQVEARNAAEAERARQEEQQREQEQAQAAANENDNQNDNHTEPTQENVSTNQPPAE